MRMLRLLVAVTAVALLSAACSYECGPTTCASGCCDKGICFEGTHERGAVRCGSTPVPEAGCKNTYSTCNPGLGLFCCEGNYCHNERCDSCLLRGAECRGGPYSTPCCAGLSCELKPGFSSSYACQ